MLILYFVVRFAAVVGRGARERVGEAAHARVD